MSGQRGRVLIVDSNHPLHVEALEALIEVGFEAMAVRSVEECLLLAVRFLPEIVLLDLPANERNLLCRRLREDPRTNGVAVLHFIDAADDFTSGAEREPAEAYLLRPISSHELIARVEAALHVKRTEVELRRLREQTGAITRRLTHCEQRYKSLFEHHPDAVFAMDRDGRFLSFNAVGETLTGCATDELLLLPYTRVLAPHETTRADEDFGRVLAGETVCAEYDFARVDAKPCRAQVTGVPIIVNTDIAGAFWIAKDVTQRQEAEELIREQAVLLDNAQEAIYVQSLDGTITFWNRSAERTYGYCAAEMLGSAFQPHTAQDLLRHQDAWRHVLEKGEWSGELTECTVEGKTIIVEGHWTLVRDAAGAPKSVLCINTNITEKKNLEAQFLRNQRMESIGTLAGGIAHDLNNVLSPIIMAVELLRMKNEDPIIEDVLNTMETSARRGADMVQQVLSFARGVEGERLNVQPKHLLKEIQKIAFDAFPKNIELKASFKPDLWNVVGDPTQLHQVLLNLCVNARDAMPDGGRIQLFAENVQLDEQFAATHLEAKAGPHVVLEVRDNGCGMSAATLDKIFDPFYTTKEMGKGTGLGLSTSLAIVRSHGGFILVNSEVGRGSTFRVHLPAELTASEEEPETSAVQLPRGNGQLILVVDDESSVRTVTQQTLEAFGYHVVVACDGVEAVSIYAQQHAEIAAVITDMMMPIMDGPAMIQVLSKIDPQGKVLAASGLAGQYQITKEAFPTVKDFLPKPYTTETLLLKLAEVLAAV